MPRATLPQCKSSSGQRVIYKSKRNPVAMSTLTRLKRLMSSMKHQLWMSPRLTMSRPSQNPPNQKHPRPKTNRSPLRMTQNPQNRTQPNLISLIKARIAHPRTTLIVRMPKPKKSARNAKKKNVGHVKKPNAKPKKRKSVKRVKKPSEKPRKRKSVKHAKKPSAKPKKRKSEKPKKKPSAKPKKRKSEKHAKKPNAKPRK